MLKHPDSESGSLVDERRRPSQKVKVLKRNEQVAPVDHPLKSQTFPEGKGVETLPVRASRRRTSTSQTFPEGKGVETRHISPASARCNCVADLLRR